MSFRASLAERLDLLAREHLRRELRRIDAVAGPRLTLGGRELVQFCSNDYLGLARHPRVIQASQLATAEFGAGSTASRLICGSLAPHHALEEAIARLKGTESSLAFSTGHATALGTLPALAGPGDTVVLDRLAHACLIDGAKLSKATLRVFRHNCPADLRKVLTSIRARAAGAGATGAPNSRVWVVTESVFSMDGDVAPLREIVELKDEFGAWLLVDEAHATGILGPQRGGWIEALGLTDRVEVILGTLGKALGTAGGFIAGPKALRDVLIHDARSFLFSTAPPASQAAAALAAIAAVTSAEGADRAARLWERIHHLHQGLVKLGWNLPEPRSPILPVIVGAESTALALADALRDAGYLVPAIRHPTVARGQARLRITVTADHAPSQIDGFLAALARAQSLVDAHPAR